MERRAKIMATLGPASTPENVLRELVRAGVDLFRLNLSHGSQEEHSKTLQRVRRVAREEGCHLPVCMDLMGPRYRLGRIPGDSRTLQPGEQVTLGPQASDVEIPVDAEILEHLEAGESRADRQRAHRAPGPHQAGGPGAGRGRQRRPDPRRTCGKPPCQGAEW
jgi:pyruvate kinase